MISSYIHTLTTTRRAPGSAINQLLLTIGVMLRLEVGNNHKRRENSPNSFHLVKMMTCLRFLFVCSMFVSLWTLHSVCLSHSGFCIKKPWSLPLTTTFGHCCCYCCRYYPFPKTIATSPGPLFLPTRIAWRSNSWPR